MGKFLQIIGVLTLLYLGNKVLGFAFAYFGIGHAYTTQDVVSSGTDMLIENWELGDLEAIDCSKLGEERFSVKYGELMSLHSSMCTVAASNVRKLGEEWFTPVVIPPPPPGFVLIESEKE